MLKRFFRRFLEADPSRIHFAAHSHHLWPDVSFEAQNEAWLDAARLADRKWDHVFGSVWPKAQRHVAHLLSLPDPATIAFAPNTHELVNRVLSSVASPDPALRILTTDGEFHSFARQARRMEESGEARVTRVSVEPFDSFHERFASAARAEAFDVVLISHVFFGSGFVANLDAVASAIRDRESFLIVDGYHGFCALPTSFASLADRAFYVAGGYKYAMSGEGVCFLHAPPGYGERPRNTGWFAAFGALASPQGGVEYASGGGRFLGATFDPTALYRFVAVMDWLEREGVTVEAIHQHVLGLQRVFIDALDAAKLPLSSESLVVPMHVAPRGHFLTFRAPEAARFHDRLMAGNVITDVRGDRLRLGFGVYHEEADVLRGVERIAELLR